MLRSRATWFAWLVLPALMFRALVPAGFMPMRDEQGGLAIMFCPGVSDTSLAVRGGDPHAHHAHHTADGGHSDSGHAGHGLCPYALSAGPALGWTSYSCALAAQRTDFHQPGDQPGIVIATIERAQRARAPPFELRA